MFVENIMRHIVCTHKASRVGALEFNIGKIAATECEKLGFSSL
jgi:hypothetical protein